MDTQKTQAMNNRAAIVGCGIAALACSLPLLWLDNSTGAVTLWPVRATAFSGWLNLAGIEIPFWFVVAGSIVAALLSLANIRGLTAINWYALTLVQVACGSCFAFTVWLDTRTTTIVLGPVVALASAVTLAATDVRLARICAEAAPHESSLDGQSKLVIPAGRPSGE